MGARDSNSPTLTIRCTGEDAVHRMVEGAQAFSADCRLESAQSARLAIIVEELVFNLVEHGGVGASGLIELVLSHRDAAVEIALSDSGIAFDPRGAESQEAIPERGGGAGIDLVRAWAEILDYGTHAGSNRLLLKMWLS